jgi:hypothetical protein
MHACVAAGIYMHTSLTQKLLITWSMHHTYHAGWTALPCVMLQAEHLSHWGINMMAMQKTDKTMAEAEIEANKDFEWSHITESGKQLMPISGPG